MDVLGYLLNKGNKYFIFSFQQKTEQFNRAEIRKLELVCFF